MKEFKNAKHVALLIRNLAGRSGGAERIYCELANILVESGYRVTCLHYDLKGSPPFYSISPKAERVNLFGAATKKKLATLLRHVPFLSEEKKNKGLWLEKNGFFLTQVKDYFRFNRPDVAISLMPPSNTIALLAAAETGTKVIATNHSVPKEDYDSPHRWDPSPFDRRLRREVLRHAAAIHVLFPGFKDWFEPLLQDRIVAIPNYISPQFTRREENREKLILAVGRLAEVKNYMQMVRSWATLASDFPDWKIVVLGTGPQQRELQEEIAKFRLEDSFILGGHRSELEPEYAKASIFCHPSHFEGFGLSPAEALHMGVPVVAYSDCTGVKEFVRDGYNGLMADRSRTEDTLAVALRRLMSDRALREKLGRNGPESVSEFTLERYRSNWVDLIESITERPR
ncbi:glycosyltransferase [Sinorhizobium medicae]|uniref:glycosyltransferase n=1 Tax=Sinorhizobium medicae TaxID=110321 RepID=UPI001295CBCC|nr:glycosyltransferase [Sinorhizobium medicae]MDX0751361.1 glycosyltransferase [Sinorhizobium medicae]MDX0899360.1 glycosyltransferase [Sinorhizobium medicae]MDX1118128.1 glycosyltransferase [Sinorhizobium medicae]MDX1242039.1 glycosyltransferase [Sinorhizobium medicae]